MTRHLVTTALEESWPRDVPLLMLGEWCRRYDRRECWSGLDTQLAPARGLTTDERVRDAAEVRRVVERLLPEIAGALDRYHGVPRDARYWRIVLGHWLIRYVSVVYNRYMAIAAVLDEGNVTGTTLVAADRYTLATPQSSSFVWAANDDLWNHLLYGRILEFLAERGRDLPIHRIGSRRENEEGFAVATADDSGPVGVGSRLTAMATRLLPRLAGDCDALLLSTYLPLKQRILLELSLGQVPQLWRTRPVPLPPPDPAARAALESIAVPANEFETLARALWRTMIPVCFVEGHAVIASCARAAPWPARPRFVFTSNAFDTNEQFKLWVAERACDGVPYIAGQHGNNYGTHRWWGAEFWPERSATDRFVTWGWDSGDSREVPAFILKTAGERPRTATGHGGLLLIEVAIPHRVSPHDSDAEFAVYQEEQFQFVDALPRAIRDQLTVRLHAEYRQHRWGEDQRWADRAPDVALDPGHRPIRRLVGASRLVVHSYDSTGILETLALDMPTICFWNGGLEHLLPTAVPFYQLLREAGILHDTPSAAAAAVGACWDNLTPWWQGQQVRRARAEFCRQFGRTVPNPVRTLRALLVSAVSRQNLSSPGERPVRTAGRTDGR